MTATAISIQTITGKGRDGWQSTSTVFIGGKRAVQFITSKGSRGVATSIHGVMLNDGFITWEMFGDFTEKNVPLVAGARCTEKAILAQHAHAMKDVDAIVTRAIAFYVIKDARRDAQAKNDREQAADQRNADFQDAADDAMSDSNYVGHPMHY